MDGIYIKKGTKHGDPRGFFMEVMKEGDPGFHTVAQTSFSLSKPGVIKAFHYHDYPETWCVLQGRARVVAHDIRPDSPTKGETFELKVSADEPVVISIASGIAHGYQVLGDEPVGMLYHSGEAYDATRPNQIQIIPEDDPSIGYDWTKP